MSDAVEGQSGSAQIDDVIRNLADWRAETLSKVRALILETDSEITEAVKWRGVPVWERNGILCTGESYKAVVKLTFAKGASLLDPTQLFNSSLEGNVRRAIDIRQNEELNATAFQDLIRAAVKLNIESSQAKKKKKVS